LAPVIYVDNTDLPHMTKEVVETAEELIKHLQHSTNVWGGLAIATGAALKSEKCYAYFMIYRHIRGRATLASESNLPAPICMIT
jgi:hypothetical protein